MYALIGDFFVLFVLLVKCSYKVLLVHFRDPIYKVQQLP